MAHEQGNVVDQAVVACEGFFQRLGIDRYLGYIGLSVSSLVQGLLFFGAAFILGICVKRYFKLLVVGLFLTSVIYLLLDYNNLITVDWLSVKQLLGVPMQQANVRTIVEAIWGWIRTNVMLSIVALIGFLVGYRFG